jgi:hypothetical protein
MKSSIGSSDKMPVISPGMVQALGLRPDSINEPAEVSAACHGNGSQTHTRHAEKIRAALVDYWQRQRPALPPDRIREFVRARHPMLFADGQRAVSGVVNSCNEILGIGPRVAFA